MNYIKYLKTNKPDYLKIFMEQGNELVKYSEKGDVDKIKNIIENSKDGDILTYHIVKMVVAASLKFQFPVVFPYIYYQIKYLYTQGLDINYVAFRDLPITLLEYYKGNEEDKLYELIKLLLIMGMDVNTCHPSTFETIIFSAIRYQYPKIVELLILKKTDINAIAHDDLMPLVLANQIYETNKNEKTKKILDLLISNGAKDTWRKEKPIKYNTFSSKDTSIKMEDTIIESSEK